MTAKTPAFGFSPDPVMRDIASRVLNVEVLAGQLYVQTDGAAEPNGAFDRIETAMREVRDDLVVLYQLRVPDEEDDHARRHLRHQMGLS